MICSSPGEIDWEFLFRFFSSFVVVQNHKLYGCDDDDDDVLRYVRMEWAREIC